MWMNRDLCMPRPKRQFVDGGYGQMHVRVATPAAPKQRPLVCLHMFPQSGRNFDAFLGHVSTDRVAVAPDFPGYGESDAPPAPIKAADYARAIWDVIDALALTHPRGSIDLLGIHAGAKLAAEVARQRPQHVHRIVLFSAAVLSVNELDGLRKAFTPIPLDDEGSRFKYLWSILTKNRGPHQSLETMATAFAEMIRGGEKYEWGHDAVFDYNRGFGDVLRGLAHPVDLINPNDDLYQITPRTLDYLQNGTLHDAPQWHHGFLHHDAADVASKVCAWLAQ